MGKFLNCLKKFSFGGYRTGLYNNNQVLTFSSLLSVILSMLFLFGLITGFIFYFNEIFIQRDLFMDKKVSRNFLDTELAKYSLP
jgi:hypothetical protein